MKTLYNEIISNIQKTKIDFTDTSWRDTIPSTSGWYFIETTTPTTVLLNTNNPTRPGLNYDIPDRISNSGVLQNSKLLITQKGNNPYIVYSGENKNLKARAREHVSGHHNTGCLALSNYSNLKSYDWYFSFVSSLNNSRFQITDKMTKIFGEQIWRVNHGWPILSKK